MRVSNTPPVGKQGTLMSMRETPTDAQLLEITRDHVADVPRRTRVLDHIDYSGWLHPRHDMLVIYHNLEAAVDHDLSPDFQDALSLVGTGLTEDQFELDDDGNPTTTAVFLEMLELAMLMGYDAMRVEDYQTLVFFKQKKTGKIARDIFSAIIETLEETGDTNE